MKNKNRKFYLNKKVKEFTKLNAYEHTIFINETKLADLPLKKQQYLLELRDSFNYSVQFTFV